MSREEADAEAGQHGEDEPFLSLDDGIDRGTPRARAPKKSSPSRLYGSCKFVLFSLFVVVTILGLAGALLRLTSKDSQGLGVLRPEPQPSGKDDASNLDNGGPSSSLHPDEHIPLTPRLRDSSEYVLSPSWNATAAPVTREYHWTIMDARLNPDGVYRPMMLINNQFPGPLVECNEGDTLVVQVVNKAVNATSIHFHGLFQNGTNFMDGTVGVTQCPIAPNSSFTYKFTIRGQSGTYWYHAHHSAQAADGLLGPVVVHSRSERTTQQESGYATDRIIMVQDHYHNTTAELLMDYLGPDSENNEPVPDNPLINGRGLRSCRDFAGWDCNDSHASKPVFDLTAGQRHRIRFINVGVFAEFQIQVDQHPFYITEVDGTDVYPEPFHRLNILPAQRYSIILETNVTAHNAYWLRARMVSRCFTTKNPRLEAELRGIVRYISPTTKPLTDEVHSTDWPDTVEVICRDLNTSALVPVQALTPPPADDFVRLRANFQIGDWALSRGFFNESTWRANVTHPSLYRFLDSDSTTALDHASSGGGSSAGKVAAAATITINDKVFDKEREYVLQTRGVRTIDIAIDNFDDGAHPFHLHGHEFFVMAQAQSGYPPSTAAAFAEYLKQQYRGMPFNPLRRDTVTVEGYSWVVIRVVLDNPGLWSLHCHNMWHAMAGMAIQVLVRAEEVHTWRAEPWQRDMCRLEGVALGSRPEDSIWFGTL